MNDLVLQDLIELVKHRYFGKYRGVVVDTNDPTERGRIQVRVPAVLGDLNVWAMPCVPYAGDQVGLYILPPVDAGVWVEFEAGDPSYPIWVGCFWADGQLPDDSDQKIKILKTEKLTLRLDDNNDEMLFETSSNTKIEMTDKVETSADSTMHTVTNSSLTSETSGIGKVEIDSAGVNVNSGSLEVT